MIRILAFILLTFAGSLVHGQGVALNCTPLQVEPNPASSGQHVSASTTCSCFFPIEDPVISRSANEVVISYEASAICGVPPPPATYEFNLGSFAPGEYTIIHAPVAEWGDPFETQEVLLGVDSYSVPTLGSTGTLVAWLAVLAIGVCHLTSRSSSFRA